MWEVIEASRERDEDGYQYAVAVNAATGERQVFHHPDACEDAAYFIHYGNQTDEERREWLEPFGLGWQEEQEERRTGMTRTGERA